MQNADATEDALRQVSNSDKAKLSLSVINYHAMKTYWRVQV
jgi:hypothetical protein